MTRTNNQPKDATPGFSTLLTDETDLGIATLIVEDEAGTYHPVAVVATISEGREIARQDLYSRMQQLEDGNEPFCPVVYKVWARGLHGFAVAAEFEPESL